MLVFSIKYSLQCIQPEDFVVTAFLPTLLIKYVVFVVFMIGIHCFIYCSLYTTGMSHLKIRY